MQEHRGTPGVMVGTLPPPLHPGEFRPHVFVRCGVTTLPKEYPSIFFVPVTEKDKLFATHALSVIGAAHLSGRYVNIIFDPADDSGKELGCNPLICKRILAVTMVNSPLPTPGN
jgi:hypothetical protein